MCKHSEYGADIIGDSDSELLQLAREIALTHHEKWDGSGYPNGLEGTQIPLSGRIVAICDVYDALTSDRPYKRAWSVDEAIGYIRDQRGRHFDPELVSCFEKILPDLLDIASRYEDPEHPYASCQS